MHAYQNSLIVQASPQEIWAQWVNPATWSSWDPEVVKASSESHLRIGTTGTLTTRDRGDRTFKVLLCDPSSSLMLAFQYNIGVEINIKRSWEKVSDGVRITQEVTLIGPMSALTLRLRRETFRAMTDTALSNLKQQLEGTASLQTAPRPQFT
ncbi:SRPBCC family protein [Deinococcus cellulosilyticus]|uniref:Uncharacterized protein n=1 Tax=Deinococcus cellulosilyticus (strain DSM 18568 / NBRC 106333 / KACC 11606 / 5516J-15) TaxID=1223518 RepID=A0A511MW50_DEIC1|nr:SRPBCC family protein [Deinococcus cellulosilyticus]GEM44488.1 hypothetical protein DC3_01230 [Deinococcus cellulosilyticus NBRC 106333 = KACC 11606]